MAEEGGHPQGPSHGGPGTAGTALGVRLAKAFAAKRPAEAPLSRLVVTSRRLSSRLRHPSEFWRLADVLTPHVDAIRSVKVLRRQADLALSRDASALQAGLDRFAAVLDDPAPLLFRRRPPGWEMPDFLGRFDHVAIMPRL